MLTDKRCENAKPREKPYKIYAEDGMYLLVNPRGSKLWQMKYLYDGKASTYSIGRYGIGQNGVTLAKAREARDAAKRLLKEGRDPTLVRRLSRIQQATDQSTLFGNVAREWLKKTRPRWYAKHADTVESNFEADVYLAIGDLPVSIR